MLRICQRIGFVSVIVRVAVVLSCVLIFSANATAYTVVLRDGRRLEIPDRFVVSNTTLTYEVKPGILVTIPLASINVAATNVANGSPEGARLTDAGKDSEGQSREVQRQSLPRAARTMTNEDLEESRLRRIKSEVSYEVRRRELGLPSREESDKRRQEESLRAREILARSESERIELENYWRRRATSLRDEMFVLDSEIDYVRARLADSNYSNSAGSFVTFGAPVYFPYGLTGLTNSAVAVQGRPVRSQVQPQTYGTVGVSQSQSRGIVHPGSANSFFPSRHAAAIGACRFTNCRQTFGFAYPYLNVSYDISALVQRLDELLAVRTGLETRWQLLEDEARRAGAQPGWLRP